MDYIKRFFGLSDKNDHLHRHDFPQEQTDHVESKSYSNDVRRPSFHIFTDPLHMQQYFEYHMNEMLKSFGVQEFDNGFFSNFYSNTPALQEDSEFDGTESSSGNLRDQFLKNGYEKPSQKHSEKADKDIDGRIKLGDLDSVFGRTNRNPTDSGSEELFFGKSESIKTVRNSDGSFETHRTVRDNKGNEETTVCRKIGDKEYCITKKRDKHGKEEIIENLKNMDEKEKNTIFKDKFPPKNNRDDWQDGSLFDKFFK